MDKTFLVEITKYNMTEVFNEFINHDIVTDLQYTINKKKRLLTFEDEIKEKVDIYKLGDLFIDCLIDDNTVLHPNKKNILINRDKLVTVNTKKFKMFFSHYQTKYTNEQLNELMSCKDRVFNESYKRLTGAFFTPKIWVDEAHKEITRKLGPNWKDEYIVWDCCAGTANLTKDYNFKELYISTLEQEDINNINDMGYNNNSTIFAYDFLNEYNINSVPQSLKTAMTEKRKILFFINPPYGKLSGCSKIMGSVGEFDERTIISDAMKGEMLGSSNLQLYAQFMYKIAKLKELNENIAVAIFCQPTFIVSNSYLKFNKFWNNRFTFIDGFQLPYSNFLDVSNVTILFTIWR